MNMNLNVNKIKIILLIVCVILISCKKNNNSESIKEEPKIALNNLTIEEADYSEESLDNLIKCGEYDLREGFLTIPDNGCLYSLNGENKIGNVFMYLVPIDGLDYIKKLDSRYEGKDYSDIESKRIGKLSVSKIKEQFDIYAFIIDKKYLKYSKNAETSYYQHYHIKLI